MNDNDWRKVEPYPPATRRGFYAGVLIGCGIGIVLIMVRVLWR